MLKGSFSLGKPLHNERPTPLYQKYITVEPPVATPLFSDQFSKIPSLQVKSLYLEPVVSEHLS